MVFTNRNCDVISNLKVLVEVFKGSLCLKTKPSATLKLKPVHVPKLSGHQLVISIED